MREFKSNSFIDFNISVDVSIIESTGADCKWNLAVIYSNRISRGICTPEDLLDWFSRYVQATNWIEDTKLQKKAHNLNYFSDDEESEWLPGEC